MPAPSLPSPKPTSPGTTVGEQRGLTNEGWWEWTGEDWTFKSVYKNSAPPKDPYGVPRGRNPYAQPNVSLPDTSGNRGGLGTTTGTQPTIDMGLTNDIGNLHHELDKDGNMKLVTNKANQVTSPAGPNPFGNELSGVSKSYTPYGLQSAFPGGAGGGQPSPNYSYLSDQLVPTLEGRRMGMISQMFMPNGGKR